MIPLSSLTQLEQSATPAPWKSEFAYQGGYDCIAHSLEIKAPHQFIAELDLVKYGQLHCDYDKTEKDFPVAVANAELICAMRNQLPELLRTLERYEKALKVIADPHEPREMKDCSWARQFASQTLSESV